MAIAAVMGRTSHLATLSSRFFRVCALSAGLFTASGMADAASPSETKHVDLQMRFVEVDRREVLNFGIDWGTSANDAGVAFGVSSEEIPTDEGIDKILEALEREGRVNILASPHLTSIDGEAASFLAGGEVPVSIPGSGSEQVEYKPFGISVELVPTLLSDDRIEVRVRPELTTVNSNDLASNDVRLSSFTTHKAETTVDLGRGQSVAIAGLFDREQSSNFGSLSDLPIIGSLINSSSFQRNETELIILVTARYVDGKS